MNYYQRIKDLREDNDLSQAEAGKIINCGQSAYGKYERGELMMGIDKYIKLAKYYNVSLDYIAGLTNEPAPLYNKNTKNKKGKDDALIEAYRAAPKNIQKAIDDLLGL